MTAQPLILAQVQYNLSLQIKKKNSVAYSVTGAHKSTASFDGQDTTVYVCKTTESLYGVQK